jgi:hypothetical protein
MIAWELCDLCDGLLPEESWRGSIAEASAKKGGASSPSAELPTTLSVPGFSPVI